MKSKKKAKIIILVLGIVFAISIISNRNFSDDQGNNEGSVEIRDETNLKSPRKSSDWTTNFIHIQNDNWSENVLDWIQVGLGTESSPHVIENGEIDAGSTGSGILIEDSHEYFIIRNCTIYNSGNGVHDAGIFLNNTENGRLEKNNCSNNVRGIMLFNNCINNIILNNTANGNTGAGIKVVLNCNDNTISENTVCGPIQNVGIRIFDYCDNNIISGNTANNNDNYGIRLSNGCDNNSISRNTANNNGQNGIFIEINCNDNTILGNTGKR